MIFAMQQFKLHLRAVKVRIITDNLWSPNLRKPTDRSVSCQSENSFMQFSFFLLFLK